MVRIKVKLGERGQLVIPKVIRESLGLVENRMVILEVKDKVIEIKPFSAEEIVERWEKMSEKEGGDVSKDFIYGDKLYEEVFD